MEVGNVYLYHVVGYCCSSDALTKDRRAYRNSVETEVLVSQTSTADVDHVQCAWMAWINYVHVLAKRRKPIYM